MCGIFGMLGWSGSLGDVKSRSIEMLNEVTRRGPDDYGIWLCNESQLVLAHRRLSIVDLSSSGHQPMESRCGRWVIAFNGEIYNHSDIRDELNSSDGAMSWRGHSDTEVLLAAIATYGIVPALKKCVGMFAFALWDKRTRQLTLARDRIGEKPLYYGRQGKSFLFGSELSSFYKHPEWNGDIDRHSLALLMRHNYIPAPYTIFRGVFKLKPAHVATFRLGDSAPRIESYWSHKEVAQRGVSSVFSGTAEDAVLETERLIKQSLSGQMLADVPLGAFLSGGIDSSTVVALMQSMSNKPVKTFSIGFNEEGYNEAKHAKNIAEHLGTAHTELYVSATDALNVVPLLPSIYSEPFSDSSQIPTYLVSKLAREKVTVSLSGDGGDELFCGYSRYAISEELWGKIRGLPFPIRKALVKMLRFPSPSTWDKFSAPFMRFFPERIRYKNVGDKLHKLSDLLTLEDEKDVYRRLISHWSDPAALVIGATEHPTAVMDAFESSQLNNFVQKMMFADQISYLPDDILVKVDRAAMAVSLESRVPLLDHRLIEFAWSLPVELLRKDGNSKWPLRQVLYRYVPKALVDRPKMGFGVPIGDWLRGALREWGESLLSEEKLINDTFFNASLVRQAWTSHQSGAQNLQYQLWDILMFQAWYENYQGR